MKHVNMRSSICTNVSIQIPENNDCQFISKQCDQNSDSQGVLNRTFLSDVKNVSEDNIFECENIVCYDLNEFENQLEAHVETQSETQIETQNVEGFEIEKKIKKKLNSKLSTPRTNSQNKCRKKLV